MRTPNSDPAMLVHRSDVGTQEIAIISELCQTVSCARGYFTGVAKLQRPYELYCFLQKNAAYSIKLYLCAIETNSGKAAIDHQKRMPPLKSQITNESFKFERANFVAYFLRMGFLIIVALQSLQDIMQEIMQEISLGTLPP